MSGIFGSTTIKGTRITDFAKTSADVGSTIPFLYGRAPVTGNVIFAHLPPDEHRQVKRQGKGGVKQETFTYTTSYAIAFCRGPIQGYWWIKRNGKVVYSQDPAAPIEDKDYAAKWAAKVMMYNGTSSQMPNSMIESYKGSGRVSAFKYLAYIAVPNEDVTEGGGAIPSYEAVPIASPPEAYLTSKIYEQFVEERARVEMTLPAWEFRQVIKLLDAPDEAITMRHMLVGWRFGSQVTYRQEEAVTVAFSLPAWSFRSTPTTYTEEAVTVAFSLPAWSFRSTPTTYTEEAVTVAFSLPAWSFRLQPTTLTTEAITATFTLQNWTFGP